MRVNADGAGFVAAAAAALNTPLIHLSTDYVFDGALQRALCRDRRDWADRRLWPLEAGGRSARAGGATE